MLLSNKNNDTYYFEYLIVKYQIISWKQYNYHRYIYNKNKAIKKEAPNVYWLPLNEK